MAGGLGNPISVSVIDNQIQLDFIENFESGTQYELEISGISDCAGNQTPVQSMPFIFVELFQAEIGDIRINEIFADPTPPNRSSKF